MKIARRNQVYKTHSRFNKPGLTVKPGETFQAETELCSGNWLKSIDDKWSYEISDGPNPSVCIEIEGAQAGQMLAVNIIDIELDNLGYTGFDGKHHSLANLIYPGDWGINTKTVKIKDNKIIWNDQMQLPVKPMIGTLGTAPETEVFLNSRGGNYGGNMDVNEVTIDSTVCLPIFVDGALLHVGDVHARQGDGEINGAGGIECRSTVKLAVEVDEKPEEMNWVRIENKNYIMTVACCRSVEESFYEASRELINWMIADYDITREEAYLLMGQVMEARCTQFVNPTRSYICKMPKKYLN